MKKHDTTKNVCLIDMFSNDSTGAIMNYWSWRMKKHKQWSYHDKINPLIPVSNKKATHTFCYYQGLRGEVMKVNRNKKENVIS